MSFHRRSALLWLLVATVASAESAERGAQQADSATRIRGMDTLIASPDGSFLTSGGSTLRRLEPGARKPKVIHRIKGDNLSRVAGGRDGAVLAAWEKDGRIHYFRAGQHRILPMPPPPSPEVERMSVQHLAFLPTGEVFFLVQARPKGTEREIHLAYRQRLGGRPELVYRVDHARLLARRRELAVFVLPERPNQQCNVFGCSPVGGIEAYRVTADRLERTVLLQGEKAHEVRMIWGNSDDRLYMGIESSRQERRLLRWQPGEATPQVRPFPKREDKEKLFALDSGDILRLTHAVDEALRIERHLAAGGAQTTRLLGPNDADTVDTDLHALGVRENGALWLHWGDSLLLFDPDLSKRPRAVALQHLLGRRDEWGGVAIYAKRPEALWISIDLNTGRDFARLSFAELERTAKLWDPPRMAEDLD